MSRPVCFFAGWPGAGPCDGALIRAHLIPKQRITRELRARRARLMREGVDGIGALVVVPKSMEPAVLWDPRCWVPVCGGAMGNAGHHGRFDARAGHRRALVVPRARLPVAVEEFAEQYGLGWSLERDYGPKET